VGIKDGVLDGLWVEGTAVGCMVGYAVGGRTMGLSVGEAVEGEWVAVLGVG